MTPKVTQKEIRVVLAEDTAQFLAMAHEAHNKDDQSISDFVNSLLRQERFRQGFPAYFKKPAPLKPVTSWREKLMLLSSGLLPLPLRPRFFR